MAEEEQSESVPAAGGGAKGSNPGAGQDDEEEAEDDDEEEVASLMILYRSLSVDDLEVECRALQLSTAGFLLLPRLLKEGVAASCKLNDVRRLKSLIAAKADVNSLGNTSKPPVVWAAQNGSLESLELLIESGANVDTKAAFGVSALSVAARKNDNKFVQRLVDEGAMVNAVADNGYTPLNWAAANGFEELVEYLLEHEADPNLGTKPAGYTPLHLAAQWGHLKVRQEIPSDNLPVLLCSTCSVWIYTRQAKPSHFFLSFLHALCCPVAHLTSLLHAGLPAARALLVLGRSAFA